MQLIFAKFDSEKSRWAAAAQATALLDAIGSLAQVATKPGFTRAKILDCPADRDPGVKILSGRHPCVETTIYGEDFIPNDLFLGSGNESDAARVLLLSGPNMVSLTSQ
jgi:DNA mismatch repair protein MSH6